MAKEKQLQAQYLDLSEKKKLTKKDIKNICATLSKNDCIVIFLDFSGSDLGAVPKGANLLFKALGDNKTVRVLDLSNCFRSTGATVMLYELSITLNTNKSLTSLDLSKNGIKTELSYLITPLKNNITLTDLNLSDNEIGNKGAKDLISALKGNKALTHINLSNNKIGNTGLEALKGISHSTLTIDLEGNNALQAPSDTKPVKAFVSPQPITRSPSHHSNRKTLSAKSANKKCNQIIFPDETANNTSETPELPRNTREKSNSTSKYLKKIEKDTEKISDKAPDKKVSDKSFDFQQLFSKYSPLITREKPLTVSNKSSNKINDDEKQKIEEKLVKTPPLDKAFEKQQSKHSPQGTRDKSPGNKSTSKINDAAKQKIEAAKQTIEEAKRTIEEAKQAIEDAKRTIETEKVNNLLHRVNIASISGFPSPDQPKNNESEKDESKAKTTTEETTVSLDNSENTVDVTGADQDFI